MATMKDIAKKVGVSIATVSRVLTGAAAVSEDTKIRVLDAAMQLGYTEGAVLQSTLQKRPPLVALIVPDVTIPFYSDILRGADDVLATGGIMMLLHTAETEAAAGREAIAALRAVGVSGIITMQPETDAFDYAASCLDTMPLISVGYVRQAGKNMVLLDYQACGAAAARHLVSNGRKRMIALCERGNRAHELVAYGAAQAVKKAKLEEIEPIYISPRVLNKEMDQGLEACDGIITAADILLPEVFACLNRIGKNIPGDVGLVSLGNSFLAKSLQPAVTSVAPSGYQLGMLAAKRLITRLERQEPAAKIEEVQPKIIQRGS